MDSCMGPDRRYGTCTTQISSSATSHDTSRHQPRPGRICQVSGHVRIGHSENQRLTAGQIAFGSASPRNSRPVMSTDYVVRTFCANATG